MKDPSLTLLWTKSFSISCLCVIRPLCVPIAVIDYLALVNIFVNIMENIPIYLNPIFCAILVITWNFVLFIKGTTWRLAELRSRSISSSSGVEKEKSAIMLAKRRFVNILPPITISQKVVQDFEYLFEWPRK